jgi:hypothetical protein
VDEVARTASTKDVMERFGLTKTQVASLVKQGMPHDTKPRPGGGRPNNLYNLEEVSLWVKRRRKELKHGGDRRSAGFKHGNGESNKKASDTLAEIEIEHARAKLRKDLAAAEKNELLVEQLKDSLISREDVQLEMLAKIARARAVLLGGPSVLAQDTTGDQEHDEELLSEWVHRSLTELATDTETQ